MKVIFSIFFLFIFCKQSFSQGIYDYSITKADSSIVSLNQYQDRKIMIVVLPSSQNAEDSAYLQRLDSIALANAVTLALIAVPSFEDGFNADSATVMMQWYQTMLDSSIVISKAVYTHKSSTEQQDLFSWLTHANANGHFDEDTSGAGQTFFVNEGGVLYAVFGPEARWSNKILSIVLQQ